MKLLRFLRVLVCMVSATVMLAGPFQLAHADPGGDINKGGTTTQSTDAPTGCQEDLKTPGVLTKGQVSGGMNCYIFFLLKENMPYVMFIALVLIIWSGIEYMLAGAGMAQQAKAKERIVGIISGIIFYFLITYILRLLTGGYTTLK